MNPKPKICKFLRQVEVKDEWAFDENFNNLKKDLNHLAAESGANVGQIVYFRGHFARVNLLDCPDSYVNEYQQYNFK